MSYPRTCLTTASGKMVDLINPTPEDIDFGDICEQLAKENRYNGATPWVVYSVAEHLCRGADAIFEATACEEHAAYFLLHDMPEAYLKDDTTPKKRAIAAIAEQNFGVLSENVMAAFDSLTDRFDHVIAKAAGLETPWPADIAQAVHGFDRIMLATEWRDLMGCAPPYDFQAQPLEINIRPWAWSYARAQLYRRCCQWLPAMKDALALKAAASK